MRLALKLATVLNSGRLNPGGGGGETGLPSWFVSAELVNDLTVNNSIAGTVRGQTNGCVLRIRHNLGSLSSWDVSKLTLPAPTDPGFDDDGTPNDEVGRVLPIVGVGRMYKGYPESDDAGAAKYTDSDAGTGYIDVGLSQRVYKSLLSDYTGRDYKTDPGPAFFGAGFLNGVSEAGSIPASAITRSDSLDYWPAFWKQLNRLMPRVAANGTVAIEWTAGNRFPQGGQPVACVEAWTWAAGAAGPVVRASTMTESASTAGLTAPGGLTVDTFVTTLDFNGLPHGKQGVRSRVKPWAGPCVESTDAGIGDDFDTNFTQNLFATVPVYHDLNGDRPDRFARWNRDGTGRASADKTGIFASEGSALADTGFASAQLAMASMVLYNLDATLKGGAGNTHDTTDGLIIVCPTGAGSLGNDAGAYSFGTQLTAKTGHFPVVFKSQAGVASNNARMRGKTAAGASIALATKTLGANTKKLEFRGFILEGIGTTGDDRAVINIGIAATGHNAGVDAEYLSFVDCEIRGEIAGATVVPVNATRAIYLRRTLVKNNRYRVGFAGFAGAIVQLGCKMEGDTNVDGACALACWMTNGEVTGANFDQGNQVAFNQASSPNSHPNMAPTKQFFIHNCRFDTWNKGGVGGCNDPAGRADQIIGRYWAGIIFGGRYANVNNTMLDFSDDLIIPGTERNVIIGISCAANQGYAAMRANVMYQDYGWVRTDKTAAFMFSYWTALPAKNSWFNGNSSMNSTGSGPAQPWSAIRRYYAGEAVYDPAGGLLPETGAPVYQAMQHNPTTGLRIASVPPGTAMTDTNYWFHPPTNAVGSQPRRTGNQAYLMGADNYCVLGSAIFYEGGAHFIGPTDSLADYEWAGSFDIDGASSFNEVDVTTLYTSDTASDGGNPAVQNFRPAPGSPLIGRRPAACAWDLRDQLGQLRPLASAGCAGALEIIPDPTPNAFVIDDQTGVDPSIAVTSAEFTISGYNVDIPITANGGALLSINGGTFVVGPLTLPAPSAQVRVRHTSSGSAGGVVNTTVDANGVTSVFSSTVAAAGSVPINLIPIAITGMNSDGTADPAVQLSADDGGWSGSPSSVAKQWKVDGVNAGTGNTFTPNDGGPVSKVITCVGIATNGNGPSAPSTSNSVNTFNPSQLSPITVFDAEAAAQLALTGATVNGWTAAGSAPVPLLEVSGSGPQYSAAGFNGRPVVTGNGTSQYLHVGVVATPGALNGLPATSTPCEIWAFVNQPDADTVTNVRFIGGWGAELTNDQRARSIYKERVSTIASLRVAVGTGTAAQYPVRTPAANGFVGRHVVHAIIEATQGTSEIDGVAGTPVAAVPNTTLGRFRLFANPANSGGNAVQHFGNFGINAFYVMPILTADRRTSMRRYGNVRAGL